MPEVDIARRTAVARQVGMVQHVIIEAVACQDVAAIIGLVERPVVAQPLGTEHQNRSEEHTSELQSLMRISYAVFCLKKKKKLKPHHTPTQNRNLKTQTTLTLNTAPTKT